MQESELVLKARAGDADAFTELVRRYQAMAFGYAYARLGDFHLAEDAAQQAFLFAWRGLPGLKQPERFGGWLRGIVRFECSHLLRANRIACASIDSVETIAGTHKPEATVEKREGLDTVLAAIHALPQAEREVTILYYLLGHAQRDVATFLNLPVTTINNRLRNARRRFKEGWLLAMTNDALNEHQPREDFATRIGEIIRSDGAIVDARFPTGNRPRVLNALTVTDDDGPAVLVEAIQYVDHDLVRCIAPAHGVFPFDPGMRVTDTGGPITVPLSIDMAGQVVASFAAPDASDEIVVTGIKAVDLLAPLPRRGRVALVGDMHTGKMVLVEELIERLAGTGARLAIFIFVETPDEVATVNALEYRTSADIEAIYLPVADSSAATLAPITTELDAVIAFSRDLATERLYPAIDPHQSRSRLLETGAIEPEHADAAVATRKILGTSDEPRAEQLRSFLTQPFFVAEAYTGRAGQHVTPAESIRGCTELLSGAHTGLSDDALYMIGPLEDALDRS